MDVLVPDLGDFSDVEVVDVLVKPGDHVQAEDPLIALETEKAVMEVPAPAAGVVKALRVSKGDRVSSGDPVLSLETEAAGEPAAPAQPEQAQPPAADASPAVTSVGPVPVMVPDLGDFSDVEVIEVLVKVGDDVEQEQGLLTLETEKATMDVPASMAGEVIELKVAVGDRVSSGDEVAVLRPRPVVEQPPQPAAVEATATPAPVPRVQQPAPARHQRVPATLPPIDEQRFSLAHASPAVRKLARELGVDLGQVRGSGHKSRVTADDVKAFVKAILQGGAGAGVAWPQVPKVDFAKFGDIALEPLTRIQKIAGPRLHASWVNIPHVTQHDEADITELEDKRRGLKDSAEAQGIHLTPLAFIVRACALALTEYPRFKASLSDDGENLVMKDYTHIGFAADTPGGLVVPVIRDADSLDIMALALELARLSERARAGKLAPQDVQGAVFTVSSLGGIGGTAFTPLVNAPEVAILGVSRSQWKPVYKEGTFVPRLMLPLSLSYDHRVIDGAQAVRFTTYLVGLLGSVAQLLEPRPQ
jgi:pyruvate dehydrogenase E2 component (dihydrolipoyllysine-residue acetyltransferase)